MNLFGQGTVEGCRCEIGLRLAKSTFFGVFGGSLGFTCKWTAMGVRTQVSMKVGIGYGPVWTGSVEGCRCEIVLRLANSVFFEGRSASPATGRPEKEVLPLCPGIWLRKGVYHVCVYT